MELKQHLKTVLTAIAALLIIVGLLIGIIVALPFLLLSVIL